MKIYEMQWKSTEDEKPAWNRAKVFIGAAGRIISSFNIIPHDSWKSIKTYENIWKSWENKKNNENQWKSTRQ